MEIHRSFGVSRPVAPMSASRGRSAHERLLARLDRALAEAQELCERAEELYPEGLIAEAFETVLSRPTRVWMNRAEALVRTVRPGSDTICGVRAKELRQLVDSASVAMLRPGERRESWRGFYRQVHSLAPLSGRR
jgi:hypothetical protein